MTAVCDSASSGVTSCEVGVGDQSVTASAGSRLRRSRERGKGGGGHVDRQEAVAEIPELRGDSGHEKRGIKREVETLRREDAEKDFHLFRRSGQNILETKGSRLDASVVVPNLCSRLVDVPGSHRHGILGLVRSPSHAGGDIFLLTRQEYLSKVERHCCPGGVSMAGRAERT